jgi:hypothetical protein|tara:strand:- start:2156 stop:2398 length:243 start_codon:yes stop_codon:yes gene_type:complete
MLIRSKYIIILLLSVFVFSSCRTKKTFNGTSTLKCADYNPPSTNPNKKKKSKWSLVLYKDGNKVGKKSKRGKSRLFKKKN